MEDIVKLGDVALKLEKYRYYLIASLSWVIFGMLFASAIMMIDTLTILLGYNPWYVVMCLIPAWLIGGFIYHMFGRFMPKIDKMQKRWKTGLILLSLPFVISYSIIPRFLTLTPLQASIFYSLIWYPSLGIGLLLCGVFAETRDEWIATNTLTYAGVLIILSSLIFIPLSNTVVDYYGVMALGLLASSIMLLIYLGAFLISFFRASKSIIEEHEF